MIVGRINESLESSIEIPLQGPAGRLVSVDAVIDTGFSGSLTLPLAVIKTLGLAWLCRQQGLLADGRVHPFDVYTATLEWDGEKRLVEVEAANVEPLLRTGLLAGYQLTIEMTTGGKVALERLQ